MVFQVNSNGDITFSASFDEYDSDPLPITFSSPMIAFFWTDIDTRPSDGGDIYYRQSIDPLLLEKARLYIDSVFPLLKFEPTFLFIATWHRVGYFSMKVDRVSCSHVHLYFFTCLVIIFILIEKHIPRCLGIKFNTLICVITL